MFCLSNSGCIHIKKVHADSMILPLIVNDSFELEDARSDFAKPSDWRVNAEKTINKNKLLFVSENAYDEQKYYQLTDNVYTIKTSEFISIDGGNDYVFGIKYITSSLENSCDVNIETFDNSGNYLSTVIGETGGPTKVNTWLDEQVCFNASEKVSKVKIAIKVKALNGSVGIDYVYGNKDIIKTNIGASISLQKNMTGIRFLGRVDKATYDKYLDQSISVGIIIAPTNALKEAGEFTVKGVSSDSARAVITDKWTNKDTADKDGYYEFACVMKNMHVKDALTVSLSARTFIRFTSGGKERYIYSTYDLDNHSRSIQSVALKLKDDAENYLKFDDFQRTIIDAYALGELPRFER